MSILNKLHAELFSMNKEKTNETTVYAGSHRLKQVKEPIRFEISQDPVEEFKSMTWTEYFEASNITLIEELEAWGSSLKKIKAAKVVALDTETTGLDPHQSRIRFIQIAVPHYADKKFRLLSPDFRKPREGSCSEVFIVDLFKLEQSGSKQVVTDIVGLIEDKEMNTIFQNAVFDIKMLRSVFGKRFSCHIFDTMIASQLVSAGYFVPEDQLEEWCHQNNFRCDREGNQLVITDEITSGIIAINKDNQKYYKPYYYRHGLADIALRHLGIVLDKTEQTAEWSGIVSEKMIQYAAKDVMILLPLFEILSQLIKMNGLELTAKIEFACIGATAEIEYVGMPFRISKALELRTEVGTELDEIKKVLIKCVKETGFKPKYRKNRKAKDDEIQVQSNAELFQFMKYQAEAEGIITEEDTNIIKIGSDYIEINTQKDTLKFLKARLNEESVLKRFIRILQKFRKIKKRLEFLDNYISSINPETERIHTSLQQLNPKGVGRFSSFQPNMQQVGNDSDIRGLFAPIEDRVLIDADYSAVEMRIMAQLSDDQKLIEAFKNQVDIHKFTAANISGKLIEEVSKEERQRSKAVNFGLIYGMSHETLKQYSEASYGVVMTTEEARASREGFFRVYNRIAIWQEEQYLKRYSKQFLTFHTHDYKRGFIQNELPGVRTLAGRLRVWPIEEKISQWGNPYSCKVGSVTELYNSPDQGSGADILKLAMSLLYKEIVENGWDDVQIIMTIHDELLLECSVENSEEVKHMLSKVMEKAASAFIKVIPVEVEAVMMSDWAGK